MTFRALARRRHFSIDHEDDVLSVSPSLEQNDEGLTLATSPLCFLHGGNLTFCNILLFHLPTDEAPQFLWKLLNLSLL